MIAAFSFLFFLNQSRKDLLLLFRWSWNHNNKNEIKEYGKESRATRIRSSLFPLEVETLPYPGNSIENTQSRMMHDMDGESARLLLNLPRNKTYGGSKNAWTRNGANGKAKREEACYENGARVGWDGRRREATHFLDSIRVPSQPLPCMVPFLGRLSKVWNEVHSAGLELLYLTYWLSG